MINANFNFNIDEITIPEITIRDCCNKSSNKKKVKKVLIGINDLFVASHFDRKYIYSHILNKLIQMTQSESGFIGRKIEDENGLPALHVESITEITWNALSEYKKPLIFRNLHSLIGKTLLSEQILVQNTYQPSDINLPSGHPILKRLMLLPIMIGNEMVGMIGLANKVEPYNKHDEADLLAILSVVSYLFV
jgi:transcriptional regulator with GAF, ATPase, and Fis domain